MGLVTLIAGCTGGPSDSPSNSERNPTSTSAQATTKKDCTVLESSPLPSADVPSELTEQTAKSVAVSIEESYAIEREKSGGWIIDGTEWTDTDVQPFEGGFYVKATVSLDAHKSTEIGSSTEQIVYGSLYKRGWYRITSQKIERAPAGDGETPPDSGWTTVACA